MTIKIAAGIVVYADAEGLNRCLSTLALGKGGFDGAIVIHRRYDHFDLIDPESLEQTYLVGKRYPNVVVDHSDELITQVEARNLYMQMAGVLGYDWLMVIDSDEFVLPNANWQMFRDQLQYCQSLGLDDQVFDVQFEGNVGERGPRPRLFLDPSTITYWQKHYWFVLRKRMELLKGCGDAGRIIDGIKLRHGKLIRTQEHMEASNRYYEWQAKIEIPSAERLIDEQYRKHFA
jgi:hypothetical protein